MNAASALDASQLGCTPGVGGGDGRAAGHHHAPCLLSRLSPTHGHARKRELDAASCAGAFSARCVALKAGGGYRVAPQRHVHWQDEMLPHVGHL